METGEFWRLGHVSDDGLRTGLAALLASGYRTEARIIAHLAEVEERRLHLREGSESLFGYATERLGLSNSEAFHRITAARIARRFPIVFSLIEQRALHLFAVCLLRDYITRQNHRELLAEASHKTKWQVQELLARRFPQAELPSRIRLSRAVIEPIAEARYRIEFTASSALKEKLEHLRALLSHWNPSGDIAVVIERALEIAIERVEKQRFAKMAAPRRARADSAKRATRDTPQKSPADSIERATRDTPQKSPADSIERATRDTPQKSPAGSIERATTEASRHAESSEQVMSLRRTKSRREARAHIPNAVRREVAERDELRCTYCAPDGVRCTARAFLQLHHERAWARGGEDAADNLRLLCASHNRLLAEEEFGREHIAARSAAKCGQVREAVGRYWVQASRTSDALP